MAAWDRDLDAPRAATAPAWAKDLDESPPAAAKPEPSNAQRALGMLTAGPAAARDMIAGGVRGFGSIGSTLMDLNDWSKRKVANPRADAGPLVNQGRRDDMTGALGAMGANTDSLAFGAGKLGGEIAGTAGAGGLLARGAAMVPGMATRAAPLIDAMATSGMKAGGMTGPAGIGVRTAGGGVAGATAAGMVNPQDAAMGGAIGAALPPALDVARKAGGVIGGAIRGPMQTPEIAAGVSAARQAGYVIPPTQARPSLVNRVLEGAAGKITTAQNASARNQGVTNKLAADALGLPQGTTITPDVLDAVRKSAGAAYDAIGATGAVTPTAKYAQALDGIVAPYAKAAQGFPNAKASPVIELVDSLRSNAFDAAAAVEKIKHLRTAADDAFRSGHTDIGRASKKAAGAIEDALEGHLQAMGQPDMLKSFRDARQLIAKTYTVQKALNPVSGSVDARKLAAELRKGKPLTGELRQAGEFAAQFPKAAQTIEGMGSLPQTSPLDWIPAGALSMATANPMMMMGVAARPGARAAALSPMVQNRLLQSAPTSGQNALLEFAKQGGYRAAPLSLGNR